ncbi:MAG: AzlD domain-containing protein [Rhizobiales bacterium]|nr:AzlD domain-containing protein [Hyphomicrobiales bacterium]
MTDELAAIVLIASLGLATYGTRIAGHLVLSRFDRLDPRIDAALDAVPAAVMTAIVAPLALTSGLAEALAAGVTVMASFRLPIHWTLVIGTGAVIALRALGL